MKTKIFYISAIMMAVVSSSCKKVSTDDISKTVTVSYPTINLKGNASDSIVFVPQGGTYSEAGATLIDDITGASSDLSPVNDVVDVSTTGVYAVSYSASNSNGFETTKTRYVVVYNPSVNQEDFTGAYAHTNGRIVNVTQLSPRLFSCDDLYGTFNIPIPLYFVDYGDGLYIPQQRIDPSLGTAVDGAGEKTGVAGSYVLDFYGLTRDGLPRPRTLTEQ